MSKKNSEETKVNYFVVIAIGVLLVIIAMLFVNSNNNIKTEKQPENNKILTGGGALDPAGEKVINENIKDDSIELAKDLGKDEVLELLMADEKTNNKEDSKVDNETKADENETKEDEALVIDTTTKEDTNIVEDPEDLTETVNKDLDVFTDKYIKVSSILLGYDKTKTVNESDEIEKFISDELIKIINNEKNPSIGIEKNEDGTIDNEIFWKLFTKYYQIDPS